MPPPTGRPDRATPDAPPAPADAELARRAALGDRDAFVLVVDTYGPAMFRYARRMLPNDQDAEDCVQDALGAVWLGIDGFRADSSLKTWVFGILANVVRRYLRRRPPVPVEGVLDVPTRVDDDDPVGRLLHADLLTALGAALDTLPPLQRACWILFAVEGMSYDDIARTQATTSTVVRGQLARARRTLEGRLGTWR